MRIAIISEGPSSIAWPFEDPREYDLIIGTRASATHWPVDIWAFCDTRTFMDRDRVIGRPIIWCPDRIIKELAAVAPSQSPYFAAWPGKIFMEDNPWPDIEPVKIRQTGLSDKRKHWSGVCALNAAWHFRPDTVVTFGVDMAGPQDRDGQTGMVRTDSRWKYEKSVWDAMLEIFELHGTGFECVKGAGG